MDFCRWYPPYGGRKWVGWGHGGVQPDLGQGLAPQCEQYRVLEVFGRTAGCDGPDSVTGADGEGRYDTARRFTTAIDQ